MNHLVILNYSMDKDDPVFPHQYRTVHELSNYWNEITVLTCSQESESRISSSVRVINLNWKSSCLIVSILRFYLAIIPILLKRNLTVFSHMTDSLSALIAPFTWLLRINHHLWYAHTSVPLRLRIAERFVTSIITSTAGSCRIKSGKIRLIGQGVLAETFMCGERKKSSRVPIKCVYVGRLDPSKRLDYVIDAFRKIPLIDKRLQLIGIPTSGNQWYFEQIRQSNADLIASSQLLFLGKLSQEQIRNVLCESDLMIHAFQGSLDKVLIEAAISKIYIATCNHEFLKEFRLFDFSNPILDDSALLQNQIESFLEPDNENIDSVIESNFRNAITFHSFHLWIIRLKSVLAGSDTSKENL